MTEAGDLLALLRGADKSFRTFDGEYRQLFYPEVSDRERRGVKEGRIYVSPSIFEGSSEAIRMTGPRLAK